MQLLFATQNRAKLLEAQTLIHLPHVELLSAADIPATTSLDVEETGSTFAENAELKARAFGTESGLLTASDDSGLEVTALDGQPGVHSKRFFAGTDEDRNLALLQMLVGKEDRSAQFKTVICLFEPQTKKMQFFEGTVKGTISSEIRGDQGFGYDPIFIPDGYQHTFGELGLELKNKLSHRAQAIYQLKEYLEKFKNV